MSNYPKPSLTADALIFAGHGEAMKVLLIQRKNEPFAGDWAFPGGFSEPGEPLAQTCVRELEEETGLKLHASAVRPLALRAKSGRDPRGWTVSQPYMYHTSLQPDFPDEPTLVAGDDAQNAEWVLLNRIEQLAFDHGAILCEALGRFWPEMPGHDARLSGVEPWGRPQELKSKALFYGGSFNPWHEGHSVCLNQAPGQLERIVVPDSNPFKPEFHKSCFWKHFRTIKSHIPEQVHVFPGFCGMEISNPTVAWVGHTGFDDVSLLMGDDCFLQLESWYQYRTLLNELEGLFIVPRGAKGASFEAARARLLKQAPHLAIQRLDAHDYQHMSSTDLRQKAKSE